jgi:hypothetical protein
MVNAWMNSAGHRENILADDYRQIGLGLALGTPSDTSWGATYTTDFGLPASTKATVRSASSRKATTTKRRPAPRKGKASTRGCVRAAESGGRSAKKSGKRTRASKRSVRRTCARRAVV